MVAIFVLALFITILLADIVVLRISGKHHPAFEPAFVGSDIIIFEEERTAIPKNTVIAKGHTWLRKNREGLLDIGIDSFGNAALRNLTIGKFAEEGKEIKRGDILFEGKYGNESVKFLSPVNGVVKTVNEKIIGKSIPAPYETWGAKISSNDSLRDKKMFLSGSDAVKWMKNEFSRFKDFIESRSSGAELAGVTMYDGGTISAEEVSSIVVKNAKDFEKEFLTL